MAIQSFADPIAKAFFETGKTGKAPWANLSAIVRRKLDMVSYASKLDDLRAPPGNRLVALSGKLAGKYSIWTSDQWRVVFRWTSAGPTEVEVVDYHSGRRSL